MLSRIIFSLELTHVHLTRLLVRVLERHENVLLATTRTRFDSHCTGRIMLYTPSSLLLDVSGTLFARSSNGSQKHVFNT